MARDSVRSVRRGAVAVAFLGGLSLAVPVALLADNERVYGAPRLSYADERAAGYDPGHQRPGARATDAPARVIDVVASGFSPYETVDLQLSGSTAVFDRGEADAQGVFRYRFQVPPLPDGTHVLSVVGTKQAGRPSDPASWSGHHVATYAFTVPG
ncbi:hypothetical protein [Jatrophihabitans lederbergiae]|uniref:Uncharacterized protein n=1 Tax=Jatrophihabitans lederbergiae TaxID=3075547 RepID=A0ABU2JCQ0_9ACTN|nr:hypothetical protein [Jatrophihabitans sp. DSM 44399]MDT0262717.1 hypothetical protein [Jatrophihabitans sp. DSM 44399]